MTRSLTLRMRIMRVLLMPLNRNKMPSLISQLSYSKQQKRRKSKRKTIRTKVGMHFTIIAIASQYTSSSRVSLERKFLLKKKIPYVSSNFIQKPYSL